MKPLSPTELLSGMIDERNQTPLEWEVLSKIQQLIEKEGFDTTERVMASVLRYIFEKEEGEYYQRVNSAFYKKMMVSSEYLGLPKINGKFKDHYYGLKNRETGEQFIILQPYGITFMELKSLIEQCDENGLEFNIEANSSHFPGRTIKIIIKRRGGNE